MADAKELEPLVEELCAEMDGDSKRLVDALYYLLESPAECDRNGQNANMVDGLFAIARGLFAVAEALKEQKPVLPTYRPGDFR